MGKTVLISGITGQDGSYLAEYLLEKDYDIHAIVRPTSSSKMENIERIQDLITFHHGDLTDFSRLVSIVNEVKPKEIFNLGAQSHVGKSFSCPFYTAEVNALGAHKFMDATFKIVPKAKFYQASTSEMFGDVITEVQNEGTRFNPVSPYAISKLYAHNIASNYRSRGFFISSGILFNHESERRHEYFVTRKIAKGVARIAKEGGDAEPIKLGNLEAFRDWGYAPDFVKGMYKIIQYKSPSDFILATGQAHTVRQFCNEAFKAANMPITWWGNGVNEKGVLGGIGGSGQTVVEVDSEFYRPIEVGRLRGDASKAEKILGWNPEVEFSKLVEIMVKAELENDNG